MGKFDRKTETKEVKRFLTQKGFTNVRAGHGKGTAWGWLEVSFDIPRPADCYCSGFDADGVDWTQVRKDEMSISCRNCGKEYQRVYAEVGKMVMNFTGRTGDYGGCINYHIGWLENEPIHESVPVIKPVPVEPEKLYLYGYGYVED